jgi:hypothetical protein
MIENGFVHIPETSPWLAEYLHEMTVFPNGKHDDQVDSTAQFLHWFKKPFPGQGILTTTAGSQRRLNSVANRNPPKPPGRSGLWNGSPNRTNPDEPPPLGRLLSGKHNFNWLG